MDVLMQLFIDDGVSSRGHRNNLFSTYATVTGNHSGDHGRYGYMSCITYAGRYENSAEQKEYDASLEPTSTTSEDSSESSATTSTATESEAQT